MVTVALGLFCLGAVLYLASLPAKNAQKRRRQGQLGDSLRKMERGAVEFLDSPTASRRSVMEASTKDFAGTLYARSPSRTAADVAGNMGVLAGVAGILILILHWLMK